MNNTVYQELEVLSKKIENNTAKVEDYKRYEYLLRESGLTHDYIFSFLQKAGFTSWEDLVKARQKKQDSDVEANLIGALLGIALGIVLLKVFDSK